MNVLNYTLDFIAEKIGGTVIGDGSLTVTSLATLKNARNNQISFLSNPKYIPDLKTTQATAVLLTKEAIDLCPTNAIVISNPYLAFAKIGELFDKSPKRQSGIHHTAVIAPSAKISSSASIGANVVVGENCIVDDGVIIESNVVISDHCIINKNVKIMPNVTIYHDCKIGENTSIHANSVIGSDGFGNAKDQNGQWLKVPQLGGVTIGKNVAIGASTTIDRGAIEDTIIGDGVKLDNQIQIGHNVNIGENTAMAAQVGIAGSTIVGKNCLLGGQVGVGGHIQIHDQVMVASKSGVTKSITKPGAYQSTWPVKPHMQWKRTLARINNLDKLNSDVKKLLENN